MAGVIGECVGDGTIMVHCCDGLGLAAAMGCGLAIQSLSDIKREWQGFGRPGGAETCCSDGCGGLRIGHVSSVLELKGNTGSCLTDQTGLGLGYRWSFGGDAADCV